MELLQHSHEFDAWHVRQFHVYESVVVEPSPSFGDRFRGSPGALYPEALSSKDEAQRRASALVIIDDKNARFPLHCHTPRIALVRPTSHCAAVAERTPTMAMISHEVVSDVRAASDGAVARLGQRFRCRLAGRLVFPLRPRRSAPPRTVVASGGGLCKQILPAFGRASSTRLSVSWPFAVMMLATTWGPASRMARQV